MGNNKSKNCNAPKPSSKKAENKLSDNGLNFSLYSPLHYEDADPYVCNDFIAVADGLGGAGCTVHKIDKEKMKDFYETALSMTEDEFTKEEDFEYMCNMFELVTDEEPDTSALWASRIVMARFINAIKMKDENGKPTYDLKNENSRNMLVEYIAKGLYDVKDKYDLKTGSTSGQLVLPTTLASITFNKFNKKIKATSMWAGDSRCYALTKDGIKRLSIDDESRDGGINNLFYCKSSGSLPCELNYKEFTMDSKCCFFVCSDGIFDPFESIDSIDDMMVEYNFLDAIVNSLTIDETAKKIRDLYDENYHNDDVTVAFKAFGFKTFEELKLYFKERYEFIKTTVDFYAENKNISSILHAVNAIDEYINYIKERTIVKKDKIINILLSDSDGISLFKNEIELFKEKKGNDYKNQVVEYNNIFYKYLENYINADTDYITKCTQILKYTKEEKYNDIKQIYDELFNIHKKGSDLLLKKKELESKKNKFKENGLFIKLRNQLNAFDINNMSDEDYKDFNILLNKIKMLVEGTKNIKNYTTTKYYDVNEELKLYKDKYYNKLELDDVTEKIKENNEEEDKLRDNFIKSIIENNAVEDMHKDNICNKLFKKPDTFPKEWSYEDCEKAVIVTPSLLNEYINVDEFAIRVIELLKTDYEKINDIYNQTRLKAFKEYYRIISDNELVEKIQNMNNVIKSISENAMSLINNVE